jgi:hypothetical protein
MTDLIPFYNVLDYGARNRRAHAKHKKNDLGKYLTNYSLLAIYDGLILAGIKKGLEFLLK